MSISLRLRLPKGAQPITIDTVPSTPWDVFLFTVAEHANIAKERLRLLAGYPPQPIGPKDGDNNNATVGDILSKGEMIIVQEGPATVVRGVSDGRYVPPTNDRWHFTRRICPSDNSCLFHAAAYVLRDKSRTDGPKLREECANVVQANPDLFNELLLERPNREYVEWIRRPTSWGGAIELYILSFLTQTEIIALDLESSRMERFGQNMGYTVRAFVVYTGRHYDAIAMNAMYNSPRESDDQVLFNARDEYVIGRAERFVREEAERMRQ
ncbi:OTU domain [Trypanosoma melophagium]|uniref:OTU domain n=1 Tax=Trypanosoma melophagium TaxID=715481 RepID=UPI00351A5504|nr:OTU domain [Trypanosoma melophagium]